MNQISFTLSNKKGIRAQEQNRFEDKLRRMVVSKTEYKLKESEHCVVLPYDETLTF